MGVTIWLVEGAALKNPVQDEETPLLIWASNMDRRLLEAILKPLVMLRLWEDPHLKLDVNCELFPVDEQETPHVGGREMIFSSLCMSPLDWSETHGLKRTGNLQEAHREFFSLYLSSSWSTYQSSTRISGPCTLWEW